MKKFFKVLSAAVCVAAVAFSCVSCSGKIGGESGSEGVSQVSGTVQAQENPSANSGKFYYEMLPSDQKRAYDIIYSEIFSMPESFYVPILDDEQLDNVFAALLRDNPDIFFTGRRVSRRRIGLVLECSIVYLFPKEEYEERKAELDAVCDEIIASLSDPGDAWRTELEIHDYIIENCRYELREDDHYCSSAYGALVDGAAGCEGYSKAMQLLLNKVGIENSVICGTATDEDGKQGPHMWNVVKINGDFYHLDCTWDDPDGDASENHRYFNVNDEMISETHFDYPDYFECTATAENYYEKTGTYLGEYNSSHKKTMISIIADEINAGFDAVEFCFDSDEDARKAYRALTDGDMSDYRRVSDESGVDFAKANPAYVIFDNMSLVQVYWSTQTEGSDING